MNKRFSILALALVFSILSYAEPLGQDVIQNVSNALGNGDAVELCKHLNPNVEIVILGEENIYSKAQAELMLRDFFTRNKPSGFRVNHQGSKRATSFAIGRLNTSRGNLRVSVFLKTEDGSLLIHQLRIEQDDDPLR